MTAHCDPEPTPIVDVHAHLEVPAAAALATTQPEYETERAAILARYRDPATADYMRQMTDVWEPQLTDAKLRFAMMDAAGVDLQIVSVNPGQYYYWADPPVAAELVESINETLAAARNEHGDRLVALGTVALQHPELAAQQLQRAVTTHGMPGVQISTTAGGRDLSSPELAPLWEAAVENDCVLFLHPLGCRELTGRLDRWYLTNIVGQPTEITIALSHLIFAGVLDRYPLRILVAHGGGYLTHYVGRAEHAYAHRPDSHAMQRSPLQYLQDMWFDTVVFRAEEVRHLIDTVGSDHVVMGSDYPFDMGERHPREIVAHVRDLNADERTAIEGRNAARLFGLQSRSRPRSTAV